MAHHGNRVTLFDFHGGFDSFTVQSRLALPYYFVDVAELHVGKHLSDDPVESTLVIIFGCSIFLPLFDRVHQIDSSPVGWIGKALAGLFAAATVVISGLTTALVQIGKGAAFSDIDTVSWVVITGAGLAAFGGVLGLTNGKSS